MLTFGSICAIIYLCNEKIKLQRGLMQKVYTIKEVAEHLNVSKATIIREITRGRLNATKVGIRWAISEQSFNEYIGVKNEK